MTEDAYKIRNQTATHFRTFTVVEWIDIFNPASLQSYNFGQV